MQTAPFAPFQRPLTPSLVNLQDIQPGQAFVPWHDEAAVYALLSHRDVDVTDATRRWCVVVAAKDASHKIGELVSMSTCMRVCAVSVQRPALYSLS